MRTAIEPPRFPMFASTISNARIKPRMFFWDCGNPRVEDPAGTPYATFFTRNQDVAKPTQQ
jgi:hypothetical protein